MDTVSFEIDDLIVALAYDFITTGRYVDDALTHINGYINTEEYTDSFEVDMFKNFPHFSKLLDSFNLGTLSTNLKDSCLDLINQLCKYQDNPETNKDFKNKIYASVLKNPSIAAFVLCNRETEGKIEKDIIGRLISFSEDSSDFNYTVFSRTISDFIGDNSWLDYRNFDWRDFNLHEKLEQMRCYGLLEYGDLFSGKGITVTGLGRSVYDVLDSFHLNRKIEWASRKDVFTSPIIEGTATENNLMATGVEEILEETKPSVESVVVEPSGLPDADELIEIERDEPLKGIQNPELSLLDVLGSDSPHLQENADDNWHKDYKGRKFPFEVRIHDGLEVALDEGRETVIKVLNYDCRVSEEYLSLLCTFFASNYNVIARNVRNNGNSKAFDDALRSLQDKELILKDGSGFAPGLKSYDALNYGLNLLMVLNPEYTEREREILKAVSLKDDVMAKVEYM